MAWYQLTTDVMVQGTPRSFGEVLDLSVTDGQLLVGLGRAKPAEAKPAEAKPAEATPKSVEAEPAAPKPGEAKPAAPVEAEAKPAAQVKPVARRRTPSPTPED
jgi:hypothetical protein